MRIKCLFIAIAFFGAFNANAQSKLAGTSWKGYANIPSPAPVTIAFTTDSVTISVEGNIIETMGYSQSADTISLKKLSGMSPCESEVATYNCIFKDDTMKLVAIKEPCEERMKAWEGELYKKDIK